MADIELVIKIPEIEYEHIVNKEKFNSLEKSKQEWLINKILNRVIDCIPLPKGHGRLIDADELTENILCKTFGLRSVDIDNALTIIEADKESEEK